MAKKSTVPTVRVKVGSKAEIHQGSFGPFLTHVGGESVDIERSLTSLIAELQGFQSQYGDEYSDLYIDGVRGACGCYSDCSCGPTYYVFGTRPMNKIESDFADAEAERQRVAREERDRAEYMRLRAQFGE